MRRGLLLLVVLGGLLAAGPAEARTLYAADPADGQPTVSGQPDNPDIRSVSANYDPAGRLSITVAFYHSLNGLDTSQNYSFYSNFSVGKGLDAADPNTYCDASMTGGLDGQHHVLSAYTTFYDRASVTGYGGYLNFTRSQSADGRSITISASSPSIANRDFRCMTYEMYARTRSSASNLYSDYDESCDCWYVHGVLDVAGTSDSRFPRRRSGLPAFALLARRHRRVRPVPTAETTMGIG